MTLARIVTDRSLWIEGILRGQESAMPGSVEFGPWTHR